MYISCPSSPIYIHFRSESELKLQKNDFLQCNFSDICDSSFVSKETTKDRPSHPSVDLFSFCVTKFKWIKNLLLLHHPTLKQFDGGQAPQIIKRKQDCLRLQGRCNYPRSTVLPPHPPSHQSSASVWVLDVSLRLSFSHFFQHISLKLTGWLTYVSQLALGAWLSNWIMDFSTQHPLSYVAVCGSMSGSQNFWVGDWGVFLPWGLY